MPYSCDVKIIRGAEHSIESEIEDYLATLTSGIVHFFDVVRYGTDQLMCVIVHDA